MEDSAIIIDTLASSHEILHLQMSNKSEPTSALDGYKNLDLPNTSDNIANSNISSNLHHRTTDQHISCNVFPAENSETETLSLAKDKVIKTSLEIIASIMSESKDVTFDSGNCTSDVNSTSDSSDYTSDSESYTADSDDVSDSDCYTSDSSDYTTSDSENCTSDSDETLFELEDCEAYIKESLRNGHFIHNSQAIQAIPKDVKSRSLSICIDSCKGYHSDEHPVKPADNYLSAAATETASNNEEDDMLLTHTNSKEKQDQKVTASSTRFVSKWILHAKKAMHALYIKAQRTNSEAACN